MTIISAFEDVVKRYPEKIALQEESRSLSFRELSYCAKILSEAVFNNVGRKKNQIVGVFLNKSIEGILADISIMYAGCAYMNIDLRNPIERVEGLISTTTPTAIITDEKHVDKLKETYDSNKIIVINLEELLHQSIIKQPVADTYRTIMDNDLFCIVNTSGSTGVPKSVVFSQKNHIDYITWFLEVSKLASNDILGSNVSFYFDVFNADLESMMVLGCTMVIPKDSYLIFPSKLLELFNKHHVTFMHSVPTLLVTIATNDLLSRYDMSHIKSIWFAGEVFPTKHYNYWKGHLPNTVFVNAYGPAETTIESTYYIIDREISDEEIIPIGKAFKNTGILIIDDDNMEAVEGEEGEICISGSSLAKGYYNNAQKTDSAFVQNPLNNSYTERIYKTGDVGMINKNGEIVYLGRRDSLIKINGNRVELAEIEHIVNSVLFLADNSCAIYENKRIILFYVAKEDMDPKIFKTELSKKIPPYMVPQEYIRVNKFPLNSSGKIDRAGIKREYKDRIAST